MRFILLILSCVIFISVNGQITITNAHMPSANDTIRYSRAANITGVSALLNKKGNTSWDFSFLNSTTQDVYSYKSSFSTPYAFYFINKVGLKTADSLGISILQFKNIYTFYTKSTSVFKALGLGYSYSSIPLAANYIDEDEIYKLPLNYGDSTVSTFDFKFELPVGSFFSVRQKGTRTNVVQAYGSITTPYKTYANTILVKSIVKGIDSLTTQITSLGLPRTQINYKWLSTDEKIPVLEVVATEINGNIIVQQVLYRDAYKGIPNLVNASFIVNSTAGIENKDVFTFTNKTTPTIASSSWSFSPNNVKFMNGTSATSKNPQVQFTAAGLYTVKLKSTMATFVNDTIATNLISIGANKVYKPNLGAVIIFPQPCNGSFQLVTPVSKIKIYSIDGREVNFSTEGNMHSITNAKPGIYLVDFTSNGQSHIQKLIVE